MDVMDPQGTTDQWTFHKDTSGGDYEEYWQEDVHKKHGGPWTFCDTASGQCMAVEDETPSDNANDNGTSNENGAGDADENGAPVVSPVCNALGNLSWRVEVEQQDEAGCVAAIYWTNNSSEAIGLVRHIVEDFPGDDSRDRDEWENASIAGGVEVRGIDDGFIRSELVGGGIRTRVTTEVFAFPNEGEAWDECRWIIEELFFGDGLPEGVQTVDLSGENPCG